MTGSPETLTAVVTLTLEGSGTQDGTKIEWFSRAMSFRRSRWRQESTRAGFATEITGVDGKLAFALGPDGTTKRLPDTSAKERRAELLHHPVGFLLAVFAQNATVNNSRTEGGQEAVDIAMDGATYSLFLQAGTNLPAKIVSGSRETSFSQYVKVNGYTLPYRIVTQVDGRVTQELNIARQFPGAEIPGLIAP
jgi:hypothetical protein